MAGRGEGAEELWPRRMKPKHPVSKTLHLTEHVQPNDADVDPGWPGQSESAGLEPTSASPSPQPSPPSAAFERARHVLQRVEQSQPQRQAHMQSMRDALASVKQQQEGEQEKSSSFSGSSTSGVYTHSDVHRSHTVDTSCSTAHEASLSDMLPHCNAQAGTGLSSHPQAEQRQEEHNHQRVAPFGVSSSSHSSTQHPDASRSTLIDREGELHEKPRAASRAAGSVHETHTHAQLTTGAATEALQNEHEEDGTHYQRESDPEDFSRAHDRCDRTEDQEHKSAPSTSAGAIEEEQQVPKSRMHTAYHSRISREANARRLERSQKASNRLQALRKAKEKHMLHDQAEERSHRKEKGRQLHKQTPPQMQQPSAEKIAKAPGLGQESTGTQASYCETNSHGVAHEATGVQYYDQKGATAEKHHLEHSESPAGAETTEAHVASSVGTSALSDRSSGEHERHTYPVGARALNAAYSALDTIPVILSTGKDYGNSRKSDTTVPDSQCTGCVDQRHHSNGSTGASIPVSNSDTTTGPTHNVAKVLSDLGESDDDNDHTDEENGPRENEESMHSDMIESGAAAPARKQASLVEKLAALRKVLESRRRRFDQDAHRCGCDWRQLQASYAEKEQQHARKRGKERASHGTGSTSKFESNLVGSLADRTGQQAVLRAWSVNARLKTQAARLVDAMHSEQCQKLLRSALQAFKQEVHTFREKQLTSDDARECYHAALRRAAFAHWIVFAADERFERAAHQASAKVCIRSRIRSWSNIASVTTAQIRRAAGEHSASALKRDADFPPIVQTAIAEERDTMHDAKAAMKDWEKELRFTVSEREVLSVAGKHYKAERLQEAVSRLGTLKLSHTDQHRDSDSSLVGALAELSSRLEEHRQHVQNAPCEHVAKSLSTIAQELCSALQHSRSDQSSIESISKALDSIRQGEIAILSEEEGVASSCVADARIASEAAKRSLGPPPGVVEAIQRAEKYEQELQQIDAQLWSCTSQEDAEAIRKLRQTVYDRMRDAINTAEYLKQESSSEAIPTMFEGHGVSRNKVSQGSVAQTSLEDRPRNADGIADLHWFRRLAQRIVCTWHLHSSKLSEGRARAEKLGAFCPAFRCMRFWNCLIQRKESLAAGQARHLLLRRSKHAWRARAVRKGAGRKKGMRLCEVRRKRVLSKGLRLMQEAQERIHTRERTIQDFSSHILRTQCARVLSGWKVESKDTASLRSTRNNAFDKLNIFHGQKALQWLSQRARKRLLLRRVLNRAVELWKERLEEVPHSQEYHLLLDCATGWRDHTRLQREERIEKALESTASSYHDIFLERRTIHALRIAADDAASDAAEPLALALKLRLWRSISLRTERVQIRRKLKYAGWRNAHQVWIYRRLLQAFNGLYQNWEREREKTYNARQQLLRKLIVPAFNTWRAADNLAQAMRWRYSRTLHECMQHWQSVCKADTLHRELVKCKAWRSFRRMSVLAAQHKRNTPRVRSGPATAQLISKKSAKPQRSSTATSAAALLARRQLLRRRCLSAWHTSVQQARCGERYLCSSEQGEQVRKTVKARADKIQTKSQRHTSAVPEWVSMPLITNGSQAHNQPVAAAV